jgi:hypothetical protein
MFYFNHKGNPMSHKYVHVTYFYFCSYISENFKKGKKKLHAHISVSTSVTDIFQDRRLTTSLPEADMSCIYKVCKQPYHMIIKRKLHEIWLIKKNTIFVSETYVRDCGIAPLKVKQIIKFQFLFIKMYPPINDM